jgi:long-subunit acyl-CoA synthetase (AMP-forming)
MPTIASGCGWEEQALGAETFSIGVCALEWVRARVRDIIQAKNKELAPFEAIRNFCILSRDLTVEAEELTPTLKPRRQVIAARYKELIEDMYRKAS